MEVIILILSLVWFCAGRANAKGGLANCQPLIIWLKNLICQLLFSCISFFGCYELMKYNKALYCQDSPEYMATVHTTAFVLACACQRVILCCLCFPLELSPLIWAVLDDMVMKNTAYLVQQTGTEALPRHSAMFHCCNGPPVESKEGHFPGRRRITANIYWATLTCQTLL